ncbi:MAG: hypothetical protein JWP57_993 [Spirosoma sp.]|nr:hypothetical protein [Spirosoma sp.]
MKTSDKLLISSALISLVTLVGSTMALRREHDKIDFNDPFFGYEATAIKPFTTLKIERSKPGILPPGTALIGSNDVSQNPNDSYTNISIEAGKAYEIRLQKNNKISFTYRYVGDTLLIRYEPEFSPMPVAVDKAFAASSFAYIIAPTFQALIASRTTCKLAGLTSGHLSISATNARVLLNNNTINQLTSTGQRGSLLQTTAINRIYSATITSHDSTCFMAERDVFGTIHLRNDSTATLKIPASLLKKLY